MNYKDAFDQARQAPQLQAEVKLMIGDADGNANISESPLLLSFRPAAQGNAHEYFSNGQDRTDDGGKTLPLQGANSDRLLGSGWDSKPNPFYHLSVVNADAPYAKITFPQSGQTYVMNLESKGDFLIGSAVGPVAAQAGNHTPSNNANVVHIHGFQDHIFVPPSLELKPNVICVIVFRNLIDPLHKPT